MPVALRDYQSEAVEGVRNAMRTHRRVLLVSATGSGKTVMFSHIAERSWSRGRSVMLLAHRIEIVNQISAALHRERVNHGVIAPSHPPSRWPVQVGMVQTVARRLDTLPRPDLLVVDEAHHAVAGGYQAIMKAWEGVHVLGATATPQRLDGKGLGDAFDTIVEGPTVRWLIDSGFLSRFDYFAPPVQADFSNLRITAGDFNSAAAAAAMDQARITGDAEIHYRRMLNGRPAIAFCASVAHAEHVAEQFRAQGWNAASVDGAMDSISRQKRIAAIGNGGLNVLTSCDIISEGTDIPVVSGAILLRPTQSLIVYLQQVGRVLRPKPDGSAAVILDHVGNVHRPGFGLPDALRTWSLECSKKSQASAPAVRQCEQCYAVHPPAPKCPLCGFVYPAKRRADASTAKIADGTLKQMTAAEAHLATAPVKELLRAAGGDRAKIDAIRKARGYHPNWTNIQMTLRRGGSDSRKADSGWRRWA